MTTAQFKMTNQSEISNNHFSKQALAIKSISAAATMNKYPKGLDEINYKYYKLKQEEIMTNLRARKAQQAQSQNQANSSMCAWKMPMKQLQVVDWAASPTHSPAPKQSPMSHKTMRMFFYY